MPKYEPLEIHPMSSSPTACAFVISRYGHKILFSGDSAITLVDPHGWAIVRQFRKDDYRRVRTFLSECNSNASVYELVWCADHGFIINLYTRYRRKLGDTEHFYAPHPDFGKGRKI